MVEMFKKIEVTIPLFDAIRQVPKYAKFLKDLCMNKEKICELETIPLGSSFSALMDDVPEKCGDPDPCLVTYTIDGVEFVDCVARQYKIPESNIEDPKGWAYHLVSKAWHASFKSHLGVPLREPGMARQAGKSHIEVGMQLEHQGVARQYKFPEKRLKAKKAGRAIWCRRRGTPALNPHFGVPLEG
ncbi:hypothetical protein AHAS_Ahas18G0209600 [Arachis hypogaea]